MLIQLRTGHIQLYYHLHRTQQTDSPTCPCCNQHQETVIHFLLYAPLTTQTSHRLQRPHPPHTTQRADKPKTPFQLPKRHQTLHPHLRCVPTDPRQR
ncbi:hypothetical protein K435DRAFT_688099 [Dendrothele bispora CBS 962.96]|uniref:Uncharacterized protein n=1 Tax=Dendrothele bispora (strain CBS 962.96) TaxID=1314807 RepID=A0A4V4HCQ9_DENBC|nr:hypothetical protein K435DRAFT_688099 [Dendrothele bispora CBS 962.96]